MESAWVQLGNWLAGLLRIPADPWGAAIGLFIGGFVVLNLIMGVVTYMIWWLRKVVAFMQSRLGPMHVGAYGLMQTPADALKLMSKEGIIPTLADKALFTVAPALVFIAAYLVYATIPFTPTLYLANMNVGVVYVSAVSSITVIAIVVGAWASNNKYALISAFRSAAQIVSYEVPFALALIGPVALAGSFAFLDIVMGPHGQAGGQLLRSAGWSNAPMTALDWFWFTQPIVLLCFVTAGLAENNITPFDIVEAESEIVAGFHIEYSGMKFALFFLAEFANTMTLSVLTALVFLGGWTSPVADDRIVAALGGNGSILAMLWHLAWFGLKVGILITFVFWLRATLPRVRVDQLMDLGWKFLIPVTLANTVLTGAAVLLDWPRVVLAAINWILFIAVLMLGSRRPLPKADLSRGIGPGPVPAREVTA